MAGVRSHTQPNAIKMCQVRRGGGEEDREEHGNPPLRAQLLACACPLPTAAHHSSGDGNTVARSGQERRGGWEKKKRAHLNYITSPPTHTKCLFAHILEPESSHTGKYKQQASTEPYSVSVKFRLHTVVAMVVSTFGKVSTTFFFLGIKSFL